MSSEARVIVSVRLKDGVRSWDIEVPLDVPAARLAESIAQMLDWNIEPYAVFADPPGRALAEHETLAEAGVWDGAWLTLTSGTSPAPPATPSAPPPAYVWKRLDDV